MKQLRELKYAFFCGIILFISGCGPSKPYQAKYEEAWLQIVKSEAWKESLQEQQPKDEFFEANAGEENWISDNEVASEAIDPFQGKYDSWVKRAYYKIISEAEEADGKIMAEYNRFMAENPQAANSKDKNVVRILELYKKKYQAHETMLSGLKSWNAFDDFGSDDLKFFKLENETVARNMYQQGMQEERIVDFLVYKLADLYHVDNEPAE